jgi:quinol monooxygenase YgiN
MYHARPGEEDAIIALHEDWQTRRRVHVVGFLSGELLRSAGDPRLFVDIVRFESEEMAEAHARDPEQRAWRRRLAGLSEREPQVLACTVEWWWTAPPNWSARRIGKEGHADGIPASRLE